MFEKTYHCRKKFFWGSGLLSFLGASSRDWGKNQMAKKN
ncbi:hypothetical protein BH695_2464 [Microcystis aeruginosa PCC 7806SL]|uniref:Uncharacterized protein n=1 Tax=Microcystis aeruginosa PCC 7806SL TaxID=1903187 RepID=A0AB33BMV3_MICA7|nr:hypothetical protein BH695_2464 [Microcystis aeruginosa PCC 7806SL]